MSQKSTNHILVGLDLSAMDEYLLSFLSAHSSVLTNEKIHFIHVIEDPSDSELSKKDLLKKVEQEIPKSLDNYEIHIKVGDPEKELKHFSEEKDIDLVLLGNKTTTEREVEVKRLVRKPFYSMLLVPKRTDYSIKKICVALDFSELSQAIILEAHRIAKETGARLMGLHSYQVPTGYHTSGKDHHEFAKVMEKNAREDAKSFFKKVGMEGIDMQYVYDEKKQPAECIAEFMQVNSIDLAVMGSKGRTGAASVLIGSVAKKLTQILHEIPLMIIKSKDQNMDFVDALKKV